MTASGETNRQTTGQQVVELDPEEKGAFGYRACKSHVRKRGWGQLGAGGPYTPC